ncbi:hypothetical protein FRB95_008402 [Tulasnella sp. JGI-2019a]|nr:hypothetical protein FRB95_008402 [Tulasnella sp. JGI-2019a]
MNAFTFIPAPGAEKVADEYIIKFRSTAAPDARKHIIDLFKMPDGQILVEMIPQVFDGLVVNSSAQLLATLKASTHLEYIAENPGNLKTHGAQRLELDSNPSRWALSRISNKGAYKKNNGVFMYPNTAGAGVNIYIVDTGVDLKLSSAAEKELKGRVSDGFSAIHGEAFNQDESGHGTWIASAAGGEHNGVAKAATIVPVKVMKLD